MYHQRLRVADVGEMAHELRRLYEFDASRRAALDAESHDSTCPLGQILLRERVVLAAFEARVVDPRHPRMRFEKLRHGERIDAMAVHAHVQRLQPLQQHECIERRQRGPQGAQRFHARFHGETEVAEGFKEAHAVIPARRLDHFRKIAVIPRKLAGLDEHPAHGRAVAADILGRRMYDDIGAEFDRTAEIRRSKRVVDNERNARFVRDSCDGLDIEHVDLRVADGFGVQELGLLGNRFPEIFRIVRVDECGIDAELTQIDLEQRVSAAVKRAR